MSDKKSKGSLREMIAQDKAQMLPLNFTVSYIVTPAYAAAALVLLIAFGAFSAAGVLAAGLGCFGLLAVMTVAFFCLKPYVRRRTVETELKRYQLSGRRRAYVAQESREEWDFSEEELSVCFNRYGMKTDGRLFYYNHLNKFVVTSNEYQRIRVFICFSDGEDVHILLPLSPKVMQMLSDFDITLDNQPVLDHLLSKPEQVFTDIYNRGRVNLPQDD